MTIDTAHILRPAEGLPREQIACIRCGVEMRRRHLAAEPDTCTKCVDRARYTGRCRKFMDAVCAGCGKAIRVDAKSVAPHACRACGQPLTRIQRDCIERRADCLGSWHPSPCYHALLVESQAIGDCKVKCTAEVREALNAF